MHKQKIMGILNVTPDSFSDGGRHSSFETAIAHAVRMYEEGAALIDVGGESTRPFAPPVDEEEELRRVIPVIKELTQRAISTSIDTKKPRVAAAALAAGAIMVNDVFGLRDPEMVKVVVDYDVEVVCMHMQGTPATMQQAPFYPDGIVPFLLQWVEEKKEALTKAGIKKKNQIFDPGIGMGKTVADNLEIIQNLHKFADRGDRLLLGASRKSFLTKILNKTPLELDNASVVVHMSALLAGVEYIRVHEVAAHAEALKVIQAVRNPTLYR